MRYTFRFSSGRELTLNVNPIQVKSMVDRANATDAGSMFAAFTDGGGDVAAAVNLANVESIERIEDATDSAAD